MTTQADHDLRMLARAAFTVLRVLKPKERIHYNFAWIDAWYPDPAYSRARRYIEFVGRQNWLIEREEFLRDDRIRMGFEP